MQLDEGTIRVVASLQRANGELRFLEPKTDRSRRTVSLPAFAVEVLRRARKEQTERRLFLGEAWVDEEWWPIAAMVARSSRRNSPEGLTGWPVTASGCTICATPSAARC